MNAILSSRRQPPHWPTFDSINHAGGHALG